MVWPRVARRLAALAVVTAPRPVAEIDSCGLTNSIGNTAILMYTQVASKSKAAQSDLHSWLVRRDLESFRRQSSVSRFYFLLFAPCCLADHGKIQLQLEGARKTAMAAINAKRPYSLEPGEGVKSLMIKSTKLMSWRLLAHTFSLSECGSRAKLLSTNPSDLFHQKLTFANVRQQNARGSRSNKFLS